MKNYTEPELVLSLQNHDKQAFNYLYDNYSEALLGIIYRQVEDKELSEDILQEAFIKIWNNFTNYDCIKGRLFTWMLTITRNLIIDTLRSKGYKKQAKLQNTENTLNNYPDNSKGIEKFDSLGVWKHVAKLKTDQKQIINLAYFSGLTQLEIATELSMPLGTVKTRMRTAISELRKII